MEKLRYTVLSENADEDLGALEVRISSNKQDRIITIEVRIFVIRSFGEQISEYLKYADTQLLECYHRTMALA